MKVKINFDSILEKADKKSTIRAPNDSWTYGYPEEQTPSSKDYIIVGWVDFVNKEIGFYGWITGHEVSRYQVVTHNSFAGYKYKTPNHEFKWGAMDKDIETLIQKIV